jgi:outer membrane PBP1 activator LpoA protein
MAMKWVPVDAFHMPELPAKLKVDPVLAALLHMACIMELSAERTVDFDESLTAMQAMGYYLQRLTPAQIKSVNTQLQRVAAYGKKQKWKKEAVEFISKLLENTGIEAE